MVHFEAEWLTEGTEGVWGGGEQGGGRALFGTGSAGTTRVPRAVM